MKRKAATHPAQANASRKKRKVTRVLADTDKNDVRVCVKAAINAGFYVLPFSDDSSDMCEFMEFVWSKFSQTSASLGLTAQTSEAMVAQVGWFIKEYHGLRVAFLTNELRRVLEEEVFPDFPKGEGEEALSAWVRKNKTSKAFDRYARA
eukprot:TRINITY_DN2373_c0_g1_i1.p1 TRINITY_DN2373_c0_g1~~TRINITY_DN2373_c0_g1_i1.p1  ORF type:complete len:149 (+),score=33.77 TRINITY_DN2373_c0_g1_i1:284-730(+)